MKGFIKSLFILTIVAIVIIGISGCRKEKKIDAVPDKDELVSPPTDVSEFSPDNPEIYKAIYFDYDKSDIKAESKPVLEAIAMDMKSNPKNICLWKGIAMNGERTNTTLPLASAEPLQHGNI